MRVLSAEELDIESNAKALVAENIIPKAVEFDKSEEFHSCLLDAAKPSKIFSMGVPKSYGGLEYSAMAQGLVLEAWGYGFAGVGTTLAASTLSLSAVLIADNEDQKRCYFAPLVDGKIGAFALIEPSAGSDVGGGETAATKTDAGYTLNGSKCWITNATYAHVHMTFGHTYSEEGAKSISAFIMDKVQAGFVLPRTGSLVSSVRDR